MQNQGKKPNQQNLKYSLVAKESWKQQQQRENLAIPADFASLGFRGEEEEEEEQKE